MFLLGSLLCVSWYRYKKLQNWCSWKKPIGRELSGSPLSGRSSNLINDKHSHFWVTCYDQTPRITLLTHIYTVTATMDCHQATCLHQRNTECQYFFFHCKGESAIIRFPAVFGLWIQPPWRPAAMCMEHDDFPEGGHCPFSYITKIVILKHRCNVTIMVNWGEIDIQLMQC